MEREQFDLTNVAFIEEIYSSWRTDRQSVDRRWDSFFSELANGRRPDDHLTGKRQADVQAERAANGFSPAVGTAQSVSRIGSPSPNKQSGVYNLIWAYRDIGYLYARLNPLGDYSTPELKYMYYTMEGAYQSLTLKEFGLSDADLDSEFETGGYFRPERMKLRDLLKGLQETYCSTMGVEILHVQNKPMRRWLIEKIESPRSRRQWSIAQKVRFQKDLIKAEEFETFIHSNFIGQKRFSLEGCEVLIPGLRYLIDAAAMHGLQEIVLGMSHRGRLNVFTNALRKPGAETFASFIDNYKAYTYGGSGDVKYHLGHSFDVMLDNRTSIHISLVANPSHLESVDPVVEGKCRGIQRRRGDRNRKKVMPVLIHGDAAFSGQGIVAETFNLSQLKGYRTGGTVHLIVNNQIGFTTASRDSRSTYFATDIAKFMPVPIFHANGDDPEAVVRAIDLAMRYRQKFGYDAVVDIICYRRLGHNESDEPSFTHPLMYKKIKNHKTVRKLYSEKLHLDSVYPNEDQQKFHDQYNRVLKQELDKARTGYKPSLDDAFMQGDWKQFRHGYSWKPVATGVPKQRLRMIADRLLQAPPDFGLNAKLKRLVKTRRKLFDSGEGIDWAFAEQLAFGSLLLEGYPIRLSGEDCSRGTFSQRHAVWWDMQQTKPKPHIPLRTISEQQGWFSVYDSPLSEFAVLGFDYGYSLAQPNILVVWEAQFGDFINGAQVIIDQFIAAGESKWFRSSGIVMLLPHGYEGQGPEHSSAHLERFLQLCAENNMQIANATTPAQYFHVLRRQMRQPFRKPLIIMTPKSLLRHKHCVSSVADLSTGGFRMVIDDEIVDAPATKRLLLCSGKIYYDLLDRRAAGQHNDVAIVRLEQIYPFPVTGLQEVIARRPAGVPIFWCQEESRNRGAWYFVRNHFDELQSGHIGYIGRPESPSAATGSYQQHSSELEQLLKEALE